VGEHTLKTNPKLLMRVELSCYVPLGIKMQSGLGVGQVALASRVMREMVLTHITYPGN
jgi:hypothetical protein